MWKKLILAGIASLLTLSALADKPADKGNKNSGSGVFLKVELRDNFEVSPVDRLGSDGEGAYINDEWGVTTQISRFRFGLNVGLNGTRHFFLDLRDCFANCAGDLNNTAFITTGWNVFSTAPSGAQFLEMNAGEDKLVHFQLDFFDNQDRQWRIQFNPEECPLYNGAPTDMAVVTRTAEGWIFEAGPLDVACLELREGGRKHFTFHGLYYIPFKLTATELQ